MKKTKKELKIIRIRENIINISKLLFKEQGYRNTTIDQIVDKALISKATFYQYFENKEKLFIETLNHSKEKLLSKIKSYVENISSLQKKDRLRKIKYFIYKTLSYINSEPYIIHFIFYGSTGIENQIINIVRESLNELITILKQIFNGFNMSEKEKEHLVISMVGSGYLHILESTIQPRTTIKETAKLIYKEFMPYIIRKLKW